MRSSTLLWILLAGLLAAGVTMLVQAADPPEGKRVLSPSAPHGLRAGGTLTDSLPAPVIPHEVRAMPRPKRSFPEQPPVIPHSIRDYQIDQNFNTCMSCHSRTQSPVTGAIAVSLTHYYDRDGQPLAAISPRRYFCLQCHVPQHEISPAVQNTFRDVEEIIIEQARQLRGLD